MIQHWKVQRITIKAILLLSVVIFGLNMLSGQQTVGLFLNDNFSFNGYTLFSSNRYTYLIDNCGFKINEWKSDNIPGSSVYLLENGNLLRTEKINGSFQGGGIGGRVRILSWEDEPLWSFDYTSDKVHQHHDVAPMPNGNILLLAWSRKTKEEAIQAGRNPQDIKEGEVWPDHIIEIKPVGTNAVDTIWEWHAWDHLVQDFDPIKNNFGEVSEHPELLDINYIPSAQGADWMHCNSIDYNAELDQILISSRHLNEIYIIDHSTTTLEASSHSDGIHNKGGDFLYRFGNPYAYKRGLESDQVYFGQHNASWIPENYPNGGKIIVFNNGIGRPDGLYSSIDIITPLLDENNDYPIGPTTPFGPGNITWNYKEEGFFSSRMSGAFPLPNGNVLICEGTSGHFFEVDAFGKVHWEYINPSGTQGPVIQGLPSPNNDTFKALRYGPEYPAFEGKEMTPGEPIELEPFPIDCETFLISSSDQYSLNKSENIIQIFGNPTMDIIQIENLESPNILVEIYDPLGNKIISSKINSGLHEFNISSIPSGIYYVIAKDFLKQRMQSIKMVKSY